MKLNAPLFWLPMLLLSLAACLPVQEEDLTVTVVYTIGDEYALVQATGYPPNRRLNEDMLRKLYLDYKERLGVERLDILLYDQDKEKGDGVRAWGTNALGPTGRVDPHIVEAPNPKVAVGFERLGRCYGGISKLFARLNDNALKFASDFSGKEIAVWFFKARKIQSEPGRVCFDPEASEPTENTIRLCYDRQAAGLEQFDNDPSVREWFTNCILREVKDNLARFDCDYLEKFQ